MGRASLILGRCALALALLALAPRPARAAGPAAPEAGAIAPADCWPCEGGCPARTSQTATAPLRGPLAEAWHVAFGGAKGLVEGAPLVWRNEIVVSVKVAGDKRQLHVLNLHDGSPAARVRSIKSSTPLKPCLWNDTILVRVDDTELEAYRASGGGLRRYARLDAEAPIRHFLLYEDHAYVVTDEKLICWRLGVRKPVWTKSGIWRGRPALRGHDLFVVRYDDGNAHLVSIDLRDGRADELFVGHHGGATPAGTEPLNIVAHGRYVFVHHALGVEAKSGPDILCTFVRREPREHGPSVLSLYSTLQARHPVMVVDDVVIALMDTKKDGTVLMRLEEVKHEEWSQVVLADGKEHKRLLGAKRQWAVAGRVAHVGGSSFGADDYQIRWEHPGPIAYGPIPARDTLVVVDDTERIVALRRRDATKAAAVWFGAMAAAPTAAPLDASGTVLFHDGSVHVGGFQRAAGGGAISYEERPKKTARREIADVRAILDDGDRLLYSASLEGTPRALRALVRARDAKAVLDIANDSTKSYDTDLIERLADEAEDRGIASVRLKRVRKRLASLRAKPKPVKPQHVKALTARLAALEQAEDEAVAAAMGSGLESEEPATRRWFLEASLAAQPDHPVARQMVRALVPDLLAVPDSFDAAGWLRLADALKHKPLQKLVAPEPKQRDITREQRELGAARSYWREDLVGLLGDGVLMLAPVDKPAELADALMMSHMVNDALEEICSAAAPVREKRLPLTVQFFADRAAFEKVSKAGGSGTGRKHLKEWQVAYYSDADHVTRLAAPPDQRKRDWNLGSYAAALAWHWMDARCPLFRESETNWDRDRAGYWAILGMSEWMREIDWRPARGSYGVVDPKSRSIDMVANAPAERLIPWPIFFATSQRHWWRLPYEPRFRIPMRWVVGFNSIADPSSMFEAQAATACYFLHHMGGTWRENLLGVIRDVNIGEIGRDSSYVDKRFGLSPEALGERIVRWARDVQSGRHDLSAPPK